MALLVTLLLMAMALVYLRGWYRLRSALPNVLSVWRLRAFMGGLLALWAAVGSPLAGMDHHLLTAHMLQHLILMTVAAPLILLGAPAITLLHGIPQRLVRFLPLDAVERIGIHPVFCWLVATATVIAWHVPYLFAIGMQSERWHAFEHATFFVAGLAFWWPVIRPWPSLATWPRWCIPLYLFLATLPCDALSAFLTFCNRVVYPHYLSSHRLFDISPLGDQECAGALMWVWVTFVYLIPATVVTIQILSPQRRALDAEMV
ncbi:MAG: cytochrome c oxidase assembly protein [Bryobacteraceae bacterium]|jgi:cytochrome c oxidase assembly factor CtaG